MAVSRISQSSLKQGLKRNKNFVADIPPVLGRYYALASETVGATPAASIDFTNIPQTYRHLRVVWVLRTNYSSIGNLDIYCNFNNDSTIANYTSHRLYSTGSATGSDGYTSNYAISPIGMLPWSAAQVNCFGVGITDILDYSNISKIKTTKTFCGVELNSADTNGRVAMTSSLWNSTNAITSIKIYPQLSQLVQYSNISLYGVK